MDLNYTVRDAEKWAEFSGDYNPIHFDLKYAKSLGMDGLSVHGMRALLDMKSHLSDALLVNLPADDYFSFVTRMRQPVFCKKPYRLTAIQPQLSVSRDTLCGVSAKLTDAETEEFCFSSKLAGTGTLTIDTPLETYTISPQQLDSMSASFPISVLEPGRYWGFIDAVLFQRIIKAPEVMVTVKATLPELNADSLIEVFSQVSVVQTHHEVHFSRRLFTASASYNPVKNLQYSIIPTLVMGNKDSGFVIRVAAQSWTDEGPVMATAVTLKAWPVSID